MSALPPVIERVEYKFLIPFEAIEAISDYLSLYCVLDHYSERAKADNYFYQVNSLYFDSPNFEFLQHSLWGKTQRFNMRARAYGENATNADTHYFLEIKQRTGSPEVLRKYRAQLAARHWPDFLTDPAFRPAETASQLANQQLFIRLALSHGIEPKILTSYQRRAFSSTLDEYARVTLDINLKSKLTQSYNLHEHQDMLNYDHQLLFAEAGNSHSNVILELKCQVGRVPSWMIDMISRFELKQLAFSKYVNSTRLSQAEQGHQLQTLDRLNPQSF